jgi:hypothetical protein
VASDASGQTVDQAMSCERKSWVVNLVPGRGAGGTDASSANKLKTLVMRVCPARRDLVACVDSRLGADSDAVMSEAMNVAFKKDFEKRGVKLARPANRLLSQEGGISCA